MKNSFLPEPPCGEVSSNEEIFAGLDAGGTAARNWPLAAQAAPGPWHACLHLEGDADVSCGCGYRGGIWSADGERIVCEMGGTDVSGEEGLSAPRYPRPVEIANARLIAAAPDLADALSLARDRIAAWEGWEPGCTDPLMLVIDAALSKALGLGDGGHEPSALGNSGMNKKASK